MTKKNKKEASRRNTRTFSNMSLAELIKSSNSVKKSKRYSVDSTPVSLNGPDFVMTSGFHAGKMLKDLPRDFIEWKIINVAHHKADMFVRELNRRDELIK